MDCLVEYNNFHKNVKRKKRIFFFCRVHVDNFQNVHLTANISVNLISFVVIAFLLKLFAI